MSVALLASLMSGFAAPAATGTSSAPMYSMSLRAFELAFSRLTFPATVVKASTRSSGEDRARMRARASSTPGSVSMRTCLKTFHRRGLEI